MKKKTSKVAGVNWRSLNKNWGAVGYLDGKTTYLGSFKTESEAIQARLVFNIKKRKELATRGPRSHYHCKEIAYDVDEQGCHMSTSHAYTPNNGKPIIIIHVQGTRTLAHRYLWEQKNGKLGSKEIVRTCSNEKCVNPDHYALREESLIGRKYNPELFKEAYNEFKLSKGDVSVKELSKKYNVSKTLLAQVFRGGKSALGFTSDPAYARYRIKGSVSKLAKLNERQVACIKADLVRNDGKHGFIKELADKYGVGSTTMGNIKHNKTWKHVLPWSIFAYKMLECIKTQLFPYETVGKNQATDVIIETIKWFTDDPITVASMPHYGRELFKLQKEVGIISEGSLAVERNGKLLKAMRAVLGRYFNGMEFVSGDVNDVFLHTSLGQMLTHLDYNGCFDERKLITFNKVLKKSPISCITVNEDDYCLQKKLNSGKIIGYDHGHLPDIEGNLLNHVQYDGLINASGKPTRMGLYIFTQY